MKRKLKLDPKMERQLASLEKVEPRSQASIESGRAEYLARIQTEIQFAPVSTKMRLIKWKRALTMFYIPGKEKNKMMKIVVSALLTLALVTGGLGATVAAAQSSMPDDLLYPVKLLSEDARLDMAGDPDDALQLSLEFASRRMIEIQTMLQGGEVPPDAVILRLQAQVENAMRLAVNQSDDKAVMALNQIREQLRIQTETMAQLQVHGDPSLAQAQLQVEVMLQNQLQMAGAGAENPTMLREQLNKDPDAGNQPENPGNLNGNPDPDKGSGNGNSGDGGQSDPNKGSGSGNGNGSKP